MELAQRSLHGGILILVILAIRVLWLDRLPKRTFPVLWGVVLLRLMAPFTVSSAVSVYSLLQRAQRAADPGLPGMPENVTVNGAPPVWKTVQELTFGQERPLTSLTEQGKQIQALPVIWCMGAILCSIFFLASYLRCLREFRKSAPVEDRKVRQWLRRHRAERFIVVRQLDGISAPLTYGIFRPVILLPSRVLWDNGQELEYILQHEYVHICHWDGAVKLAMVAALCVHWFNPLVWVMVWLLNRDIELACDEGVLRRFGEQARAGYAMALIGMEEKKRGLMPLYNGFSKNAIEERIQFIMKYKKMKYVTAIAASLLVAVTALMFATSAKTAGAITQAAENPAEGIGSTQAGSDEVDMGSALMDPPKGNAGVLESNADLGRETGLIADAAYSGGVSTNAAETDNGAGDGLAPGETGYMLRYMQEGMLQEEPADLYMGQGYCLLIPVEGWEIYAPDAWMWEHNEQVQFWVSDYTGNSLEQSVDRLKKDGYSQIEEGLLSKEKDGRIFFALMRESGNAVMCMNYVYPTDSEHMEGFGTILPAIAANFSILPEEGQEGLSEDGREAEQLALAFWKAYLAGNRETMAQYLTKDCQDREVFPDGVDGHVAAEVSVNAVKGLDMGTKAVGESCEIWVEFWPAAGADHLECLTLNAVKEADGWKISSYGLEL